MEGSTAFLIPMSDIKKAVGGSGNLPGTKIKVMSNIKLCLMLKCLVTMIMSNAVLKPVA